MAERALVVDGPGSDVDRDGLARWCEQWGRAVGMAVEVVGADDGEAAAEVLRRRTRGACGIVVNAGSAREHPALLSAVADAEIPIVWADLLDANRGPARPAPAGLLGVVRGRGVHTYRWAIRLLAQRLAWPFQQLSYGTGQEQYGDLRLPLDGDGGRPHPVAVVLHGGFWREPWERDTIEPVAIDLARRGYATWTLEYRRVGRSGGGWPATFADVAAGIDHLRSLAADHPVDPERVVVIGHSAGGHLALWSVGRRGLPAPAAIRPRLVVSLAGSTQLVAMADRGTGNNAVGELMGGSPAQLPEAYDAASPLAGLPLGIPQIIVHGRDDELPDLVDLARGYCAAALAAGDKVELLEFDDHDHFSILEPDQEPWQRTAARIAAHVPTDS